MRRLQDRVRLVPVTASIISVCVLVFMAEAMLTEKGLADMVWWMGLSRQGLILGMWWTLVTHLFLHANLVHLMVNMFGLWFIGPEVELMLGRARYLSLYLLSGIAGGVLQTAFSAPTSELVGASGALCGVLLSFTTANPEVRLQALIFFVIPVRMKAKTLGWGLVGISFLAAVVSILPWIGHLAHLGGALMGAFLTWWWMPSKAHRKSKGARNGGGRDETRRVDDLLARVVSDGIESLSREERQQLERLADRHGKTK